MRGLGLPVRFLLTAGQRNDITQAHGLIAGLSADWVMGDTAYDEPMPLILTALEAQVMGKTI